MRIMGEGPIKPQGLYKRKAGELGKRKDGRRVKAEVRERERDANLALKEEEVISQEI